MIEKYKNRAWKAMAIGGGVMLADFAGLYLLLRWMGDDPEGTRTEWIVCAALMVMLVGMYFYLRGCADLAKARGHSGAIVGAIYVMGVLSAVLVFFMPLIIILGMEDKNKPRRSYGERRAHRQH